MKIDRALCKECGICIEFCPRKAVNKELQVDPEKCNNCLLCADFCPDFAIGV